VYRTHNDQSMGISRRGFFEHRGGGGGSLGHAGDSAVACCRAECAEQHIFVEKPLSLTIEEGRIMSNTVRQCGRVLQVGSQQRSDVKFRQACELARNGRLGKLHTVTVAFGTDPGCGDEPEMPVPANLDYEFWGGRAGCGSWRTGTG